MRGRISTLYVLIVMVAAVMSGIPSAGGVLQQAAVQASPHEKLGRNEPCWCGSGKKFKKCHGA